MKSDVASMAWEEAHGDNEATWAAYRARASCPNFLVELERWRWNVVCILVGCWETLWQDAEDAFSAYLVDVTRALAGQETSKHTSKERVLSAPKRDKWLPFLVYRAKNRLRPRRDDHVSASVGKGDGAAAVVDQRTPPPCAPAEQREQLDLLFGDLRRVLAGRRGSDLHFRVVAGRLLGLDYAEIGLRVHRSAGSCRVAYTKALKRVPPWLLDRLEERKHHAA